MLAGTAKNLSKMGPLRNRIDLRKTIKQTIPTIVVKNPGLDTNPHFHKTHFYENQSKIPSVKEDVVPNQ